MAKLKCEICGGSDLLKQGDVWVCQTCGSNYTAEDVKKMFQAAANGEKLIKKDVKPKEEDEDEEDVESVATVNKSAVNVKLSDFSVVAGVLTEYRGSSTNVVVPDGVIELGEDCFRDMDHLQSVKLPTSLKKIGAYAFSNCKKLKAIELPKDLEEIGSNAFYNCSGLTTIDLPDGLVHIGLYAFESCTKLTSIRIPGTVATIDESAFLDCTGLTSIEIAKRVVLPDQQFFVHVGKKAFYGCTNVKTVIGNGQPASRILEELKAKSYAPSFSSANTDNDRPIPVTLIIPEGTKEVIGPGTLQSWDPRNNLIAVKLPSTAESVDMFGNCKQLTSVAFPDGLKKIAGSAFSGCDNLRDVQIPSSITYIGNEAFGGCRLLAPAAKSKISAINPLALKGKKQGCYVATCVYGSYDCPEVWTLRRYRDDTLGATRRGRLFIRFYYAISPTIVKWFGKRTWFKNYWRKRLDHKVSKLQESGVECTPYMDKDWRK